MNLPPPLTPLEEDLLLAIYLHQFDRGEDTAAGGLDWREWAEEQAGVPEDEALAALEGLTGRHLVEGEDAFGMRARLRLRGVLRAEKSGRVDHVFFVVRQKSIRRRMLAALLGAKAKETRPPFTGRTVEQLAAEIGEPAGEVLANYWLLRLMGFVTGVAGGRLIRIAEGGEKALGDGQGGRAAEGEGGYEGWPLG